MKCISTPIPGLAILESRIFEDARGYFCETYSRRELESLGITADFVQDNESLSTYGVIRGLHYQKGEDAQAKLVRVLEGAVLDVAVDLRVGSPTFGRHAAVLLTGENRRQLFIPKGFAHGFAVLSDRARFAYKCDAFYAPESEGSVNALDPELGIDWPIPVEERRFSAKDRRAPAFADYRREPVFFMTKEGA